jgi:hypothetical protein
LHPETSADLRLLLERQRLLVLERNVFDHN